MFYFIYNLDFLKSKYEFYHYGKSHYKYEIEIEIEIDIDVLKVDCLRKNVSEIQKKPIII